MAIYTPMGLEIELPVPYAFGLIARLFPRTRALDVLKTTEGINQFPEFATFVAAIISFALHLDPIQIAYIVGITCFIAYSLTIFGIFVFPGQVSIGILFRWASWYGLLHILVFVSGFIMTGWQGVFAYSAGHLIGRCLSIPFQVMILHRYSKLTGQPFTTTELNFCNAYRIHAAKHGITTDIDISEIEMEESNWRPAFEDLATQRPKIAARFVID